MARVLIAWELGEALGHLARCLRLADGLCNSGYSVAMALKDVRLPLGGGVRQGMTVLQAPLTPQHRPSNQRMPVNYADMLRYCGFDNTPDVAARLAAWDGVFSLARPDVLVADHAPTALLAAHRAAIPHMAIGNGFAVPPAVFPWPSIRPWEEISGETLVAAERRLDRVTEAAQKSLGYGEPVRIRDLFGEGDVLDTFAELDHYGERPNGCYVGPIVSVSDAQRVDWQDNPERKVLAYLRPEVPGFPAIMSALADLDADVLCVAPGLAPDVARRFATRRLRISLVPVALPPLLSRANLAVNYGSSGFVTQALLAGVPLLMRPKHVEQVLLARRVEAIGAGRLSNTRADAAAVAADLQALLYSPDHRRAAQAFGNRHRQFSPEQSTERAQALIGRTLAARHVQERQEKSSACLH